MKRSSCWPNGRTPGRPKGSAKDAPTAPTFPDGWQLGKPDLVLESPPFDLPAGGPNRFRNFVLSVPAGAGPVDEPLATLSLTLSNGALPLNVTLSSSIRLGGGTL
jgi:hypothetical protein